MRSKKQFCVRGHDTYSTGRYAGHNTCKQCVRDKANANYKKNPIAGQVQSKAYAENNREKVRERSRRYLSSRSKRVREIGREYSWRKTGILTYEGRVFTQIDYDRLYQIQSGKCAICNTHQIDLKRSLVVDHDHKTNFVRGLLCQKCNKGLGHFFDDPTTLQKAITYLLTGRRQ